jgi:pimeloyl-ACP methyl ester carboxylesterase
MSAILLDSEIVHYEVLGRGRPVIFLHGWVGSWRYWVPAMQVASATYRAYALDLWGFGDTAKARSRYTLDQQAALLSLFMEQMGMVKVALIGHSLGAVVALFFARHNPNSVDRVMAVSCPLDDTMVHPRLRSSTPAELADWLLGRTPLAEPARADAPKTDLLAISTSIGSLPGANLRQLAGSLPTACLRVYGRNDPAVAVPKIEELADIPEQTHEIVFDQSSHFPMLDDESKFNRLLVDFLALNPGESPQNLQLKEEWKRRVR